MGKYILEGYHHRVFGAVASLKGQFEGPEWRRLQEMHKYDALSGPEREKAMASAIGPLPAAADVQAPRAEDSNALLRADALRWLAYRTAATREDITHNSCRAMDSASSATSSSAPSSAPSPAPSSAPSPAPRCHDFAAGLARPRF